MYVNFWTKLYILYYNIYHYYGIKSLIWWHDDSTRKQTLQLEQCTYVMLHVIRFLWSVIEMWSSTLNHGWRPGAVTRSLSASDTLPVCLHLSASQRWRLPGKRTRLEKHKQLTRMNEAQEKTLRSDRMGSLKNKHHKKN